MMTSPIISVSSGTRRGVIRACVVHLPHRRRVSSLTIPLHRQQSVPIQLALMHALGHAQVVEEREEVERIPERNSPFEDGADVGGFVQRYGERNSKEDEDEGDEAFDTVGDFEFADIVKVVADPAILKVLRGQGHSADMLFNSFFLTHLYDSEYGAEADAHDEE